MLFLCEYIRNRFLFSAAVDLKPFYVTFYNVIKVSRKLKHNTILNHNLNFNGTEQSN